MKIEDVVFDIGQTRAYYPVSLNWSTLYQTTFESVVEKNQLTIIEEEYYDTKRLYELR